MAHVLRDLELYEISLVLYPANPHCIITSITTQGEINHG